MQSIFGWENQVWDQGWAKKGAFRLEICATKQKATITATITVILIFNGEYHYDNER